MGNRRSSKRTFHISAILLLGAAAIILTVIAAKPNSHQLSPPTPTTSAMVHPDRQFPSLISPEPYPRLTTRPMFPYSVVPGGVQSPQELVNAMANDPVVASHYAGFNVAAAHVVALDKEQVAYVSYRIGSELFWTKKAITLHKNETVITDGNLEARTRCGNRISATPQLPVSPQEPAVEAMDAVQTSEISSVSDVAPDFDLDFRPTPLFAAPESHFVTGGQTPISSNVPPIWGPVSLQHHDITHHYIPAPPPVDTPEPGAGLFLVLGLSVGALFGKLSRANFRSCASRG
jgi:hypothetical protein